MIFEKNNCNTVFGLLSGVVLYSLIKGYYDKCNKDAKIFASMGLFGDEGIEFLFRDNTVAVEVSSFDHFLEDIIIS